MAVATMQAHIKHCWHLLPAAGKLQRMTTDHVPRQGPHTSHVHYMHSPSASCTVMNIMFQTCTPSTSHVRLCIRMATLVFRHAVSLVVHPLWAKGPPQQLRYTVAAHPRA